MGYTSLAEELVKHKLALIVIGAVFFLLGAFGGLSKVGLNFVSPAWGFLASVIGLIFLAVGLFSYLKPERTSLNTKAQASDLMKIDGQYHTETHHYQIFIIPLPKDSDSSRKHNPAVDYYRIQHADWEGVGFFDNECFYTVFQINEKATPPERRGNWGGHLAKWRAAKKSFEVFGVELKEKEHYDYLQGEWIWEKKLE